MHPRSGSNSVSPRLSDRGQTFMATFWSVNFHFRQNLVAHVCGNFRVDFLFSEYLGGGGEFIFPSEKSRALIFFTGDFPVFYFLV